MKIGYKIRTGAKRSKLLLQCNYNPPGFLGKFFLRSYYSWPQRHADTPRQWLKDMFTLIKRSQPDMPTFSHVDMLAGSHVGVLVRWHWPAETLTTWRAETLTWWYTGLRHSDWLAFWHADRLVCLQTHWWRHPEDTLMLTFWHNDMQTSRHGDLLTCCWRANMLTCRYANVQARWCWHTDLLLLTADMLACRRRADMWLGWRATWRATWRANMVTCRYANVQTRWQAGLLTCWHWNVQTHWHVDILSHWNADKGTV